MSDDLHRKVNLWLATLIFLALWLLGLFAFAVLKSNRLPEPPQPALAAPP